ncbi:MAG TPA: aminoacyl-tRNA hydrolase [Candidatus Acidoferrum sp.]|nr:aminoacyl-tRNA hydrolase [Candidatus Acidoferrum sp.]
MNKLKQIIVVRKDLHMRKGKMIAQGAHASATVIRQAFDNIMSATCNNSTDGYQRYAEFREWMYGEQTKICVSVDSEQELFDIHAAAQAAALPCSLILDSGHTEFDKPTYTSCAVGPAKAELIDPITGSLKLL